MNRKSVFVALSAALMLAVLVPVNTASALDIIKGPYLQNVTETSVVIMWETDAYSDSTVSYNGGTKTDSSLVTIHEIQLTGLYPGRQYYYTVASAIAGEIPVTSDQSEFSCAPDSAQPFRFAVFGDTQPLTDFTTITNVINGIIGSNPDIVLHTGDLVWDGTVYNNWAKFFDPSSALMNNTPLFPVMGNHEIFSPNYETWFYNFFSLPDNGTGHGVEQWYTFIYGNVQFFGLDTNVESVDQDNWLAGQLEESRATWKVVYFHEPPYTAASSGNNQYVIDHWIPLFQQYGVNMVFSGHTHAYERYYDQIYGTTYLVSGGGTNLFSNLYADKLPPGIVKKKSLIYTPHYCTIDVDVENEWLTLNARYASGISFDNVTITNTTPVPPQVEATGLVVGKYIPGKRGAPATFTPTNSFNRGETVVIRAKSVDSDTTPIYGARMQIAISGPEATLITSGSSGSDGWMEVKWVTSAPNKKGVGGTPIGGYAAKVMGVTAPGYAWNGNQTPINFSLK
jgi:acid phosphatase type 7